MHIRPVFAVVETRQRPSAAFAQRAKGDVMATMNGVILPGNSTVEHVQVEVPEPGYGQVLLQM